MIQAVRLRRRPGARSAWCTGIGSRLRGHDPLLALVLTGVVIGTLLGSAIALLKYLADPYNQLPAITYWLLGSLAAISPKDLLAAAPLALLGLVPMLLLRWRMNLLALPDDEARALGVDTRKLRTLVVACATLMTASAVAISGIIGWVGLLIPHAARLLVGPDFGRLLPLAMLLGAAFLLAVDTLCRTIATIEVPPGVLTALIGTPFFLWLFALARRPLVMLTVESLAFGFPGPHHRPRRELHARRGRSDVRARPERRRQDHAVPDDPGPAARLMAEAVRWKASP